MYAIGDELNAVVLCELAILFALVCSIGIDRLHVIASNILRGIYASWTNPLSAAEAPLTFTSVIRLGLPGSSVVSVMLVP